MELNPLSDISELREKFSASWEALLLTILLSACQYSQTVKSSFLSQNILWNWQHQLAVDKADGIVEIAEVETVDEVGDVLDGVAV